MLMVDSSFLNSMLVHCLLVALLSKLALDLAVFARQGLRLATAIAIKLLPLELLPFKHR
jgi:hypothetical protein